MLFSATLIISFLNISSSTLDQSDFKVIWNEDRNKVELTWSYEGDSELSHIIIQRKSEKEEVFVNIGYVLPNESAENLSYSYVDESISNAETYTYRLEYVLNSGEKTRSNVKECQINDFTPQNEDVHKYIFPNPADKELRMRLIVNMDSKLSGGIYRNTGEKIKNIEIETVPKGLSEYKFDIESIEEGDYLMILKIGSENLIEKIKISR